MAMLDPGPQGISIWTVRSGCGGDAGCWFGEVTVSGGGGPFEVAVAEVFDRPPGVVFLVVVFRAEVGKVVVVGKPVILPIPRMVQITAPGRGATSGCPTGFVPHSKPRPQVRWDRIPVTAEGEQDRKSVV